MGLIIVMALRLTAPLIILRSPFWGSLLALAADTADILIFQLTEFPAWEYQRFDKVLDLYYIALQAVVAQGWEPAPRWTANMLLAYRLIGTALYETSGTRALLFIFPNFFTFFVIVVAGMKTFGEPRRLTPRRTIVALASVIAPTLALEYALHYAKWFDNLVAVDIIEDSADAVIDWLKEPIR